MGGSKKRDHAANYVLICSLFNGLIESDSKAAELARRYGWKLNSWEDPKTVPVFDVLSATWFILDDDYGRSVVGGRKP